MIFIQNLLAEYPYLGILQLGFVIWMLVDAHRRGVEPYWFWIILLGQPGIGALVYFILYKLRDFRVAPNLPVFSKRPSLNELHYKAEQVPTLANHLALAERLVERREYTAAIPHLEEARKREPEHGQVLFFLARCHKEEGRPGEALPLLETVLRRDCRFANYSAWRVLVEVREECGDASGALQSCRELEKSSPTLEHRCLLAEHLLADGRKQEAQALLEKALQENAYLPGYIRRRNWRWAWTARSILRRCAKS